jgi:hypothetical protein
MTRYFSSFNQKIFLTELSHLSNEDIPCSTQRLGSSRTKSYPHYPSYLINDDLHGSNIIQNRYGTTKEDNDWQYL